MAKQALKILTVFTSQDFHGMFDHFSTLRKNRLNDQIPRKIFHWRFEKIYCNLLRGYLSYLAQNIRWLLLYILRRFISICLILLRLLLLRCATKMNKNTRHVKCLETLKKGSDLKMRVEL